jgi:hypothetical protein
MDNLKVETPAGCLSLLWTGSLMLLPPPPSHLLVCQWPSFHVSSTSYPLSSCFTDGSKGAVMICEQESGGTYTFEQALADGTQYLSGWPTCLACMICWIGGQLASQWGVLAFEGHRCDCTMRETFNQSSKTWVNWWIKAIWHHSSFEIEYPMKIIILTREWSYE